MALRRVVLINYLIYAGALRCLCPDQRRDPDQTGTYLVRSLSPGAFSIRFKGRAGLIRVLGAPIKRYRRFGSLTL